MYVQAADFVADEISRGQLRPGQRLPAERDLAEQWGIAYLMVRRAMRGLVVAHVGKGTFVAVR